MEIAKLVPVQVEVVSNVRGKPRWRWVDGFKVVTPSGLEVLPHMRKREARRYCRENGWAVAEVV